MGGHVTVVTRLGGEHFAALLALQDSCFDGALLLSRMLLHDVLDQRDARGERLGAQAAGVHPGLLLLVGVAVPAGHVLGEMVPPVAPVAADVAYEQGLLVVGRSVLLEACCVLKVWLHSEQAKGRESEWIWMCSRSLAGVIVVFPQIWHWYLRSCLWVILWTERLERLLSTLPHSSHGCTLSVWVFMWAL